MEYHSLLFAGWAKYILKEGQNEKKFPSVSSRYHHGRFLSRYLERLHDNFGHKRSNHGWLSNHFPFGWRWAERSEDYLRSRRWPQARFKKASILWSLFVRSCHRALRRNKPWSWIWHARSSEDRTPGVYWPGRAYIRLFWRQLRHHEWAPAHVWRMHQWRQNRTETGKREKNLL